ncbi:MAG: carbon-nitrogen family hydrolase [Candidatus Aureabacteria bacterium]|nr:carbon-nitrogen family hydrolase [Candidatus Auribacterota bacterium]
MIKKRLNVHLLQFSISWEKREKNFKKVLSILKKNRIKKGSIICLPEYFATGFTLNSRNLAEDEKGPTSSFLSFLAKEYSSFVIGSSIIKTSNKKRPTNSALVFSSNGKRIVRYDKSHLFTPGKEKTFYSRGKNISTFKVKGKLFAVVICFDLRFPELFRILYEKNVTGIFVIANWPETRHHHWETLLRARAIENQCFIFGVNRKGSSPYQNYKGGTSIIGPFGNIIESSGRKNMISAEIDINNADNEKKRFSIKNDRAFDTYKKYNPYK